jgi:uncharacterized protein (DUF1501 family)
MSRQRRTHSSQICPGPIDRREFLRIGLTGFATLSLPGLFQLRAAAAAANANKPSKQKTAIILVWLRGGLSHLESYDPKPNAPSEVRGIYGTIPTCVPGLRLGELCPLHAKIADKFTIVRSWSHTGGGHPSGSLQMLTGDSAVVDKPEPTYPDWMTVANYVRSKDDAARVLPNYVGVNPIENYDIFKIAGPGYVNPAYGPFSVYGDPSAPKFDVPNIGLKDRSQVNRLNERVDLKHNLDRLARAVDQSGTMSAIDGFESQALHLLTSPAARDAFDLSREPDHIRDRYGRHAWGQQCLMARRLVEAGVEIVTTTLDGKLAGRVGNWDDHAVNHHVFDAYRLRMPYYDQAVSALIEDIYARGLDKRVLVCVTGEFGRTPRITTDASTGGGRGSCSTGTRQPGRDHWCAAFSNLWAGGGIPTGGVIGSTDKLGEHVKDRRFSTGDFLATIYHHLGIDPNTTIPDFSGRPTFILPQGGTPIPELRGVA